MLQGLVRPLAPAFRLARIGTGNLDVERVERATELRHAVTAQRALMVDAKDAVLVAVKTRSACPTLPDKRASPEK